MSSFVGIQPGCDSLLVILALTSSRAREYFYASKPATTCTWRARIRDVILLKLSYLVVQLADRRNLRRRNAASRIKQHLRD